MSNSPSHAAEFKEQKAPFWDLSNASFAGVVTSVSKTVSKYQQSRQNSECDHTKSATETGHALGNGHNLH